MTVKHNEHVKAAIWHNAQKKSRDVLARKIPVTVYNFYMGQLKQLLAKELTLAEQHHGEE